MEFVNLSVPVDAIQADTVDGTAEWVDINTKYSELLAKHYKKEEEDVPKDQEKWKEVK